MFMLLTLLYYRMADSVQLAIENLQLSFNALQEALINVKLEPEILIIIVCISTANGFNSERVAEYKYLGIQLSKNLTFNYHIDKIVSQL